MFLRKQCGLNKNLVNLATVQVDSIRYNYRYQTHSTKAAYLPRVQNFHFHLLSVAISKSAREGKRRGK